PPRGLQIALELDAERTVVPAAVQAAVNLAGRKDEAAALRKGNELFHRNHDRCVLRWSGGREARQYKRRASVHGGLVALRAAALQGGRCGSCSKSTRGPSRRQAWAAERR